MSLEISFSCVSLHLGFSKFRPRGLGSPESRPCFGQHQESRPLGRSAIHGFPFTLRIRVKSENLIG